MRYPVGLLLVFSIILSCEEEAGNAGFTITQTSGNEGDGKQTLTINLGKTASSETKLYFITGGTAGLDGDYTLLTEALFYATTSARSITIPAGESSATLSFNLIDDGQIEPREEVIYFQITGSSDGNLDESLGNAIAEFRISDNDTPPASGLQVDLSWYVDQGASINTSNFDLFLAKDVVFDEVGEVSSFEEMSGAYSANERGFETLILDSELSDTDYYVIIRYMSGSADSNVSLGFSQGTRYGRASGWISPEYVGKDIFYGPIQKSGNSFSFN